MNGVMGSEATTRPAPSPADLEARGYERRAVVSGPKLEEQSDYYRELGFEVVLVPAPKDPDSGCDQCFGLGGSFIIYTRKPGAAR